MLADLITLLSEITALGRKDAIAVRQEDGSYRPTRLQGPVPRSALEAHLTGISPVGVYLVSGNTSRIGAIDFDDHGGAGDWAGMAERAASACGALIARGFRPLAVRSGGGRGIHVFVFFPEPQSARAVRLMLTSVLAEIGMSIGTTGVAEGAAEVFPKQDEVPEGGLGNLIALPFARASVPLDPADMSPISLSDYRASRLADLLSESLQVDGETEQVARQANTSPPLPGDDEQATTALRFVSADDYHDWIRVGLALKCAFVEAGLDIWTAWSRRSPKFKGDADCLRVWRGLKPRGSVGLGTIFHMAQKGGWNGPTNPLVREMNARFGVLVTGKAPMVILKDPERRPSDENFLIGTRSFEERMKSEPLPTPPGSGAPANKAKVWMNDPLAARYHNLDFDPAMPPGHNGKVWNLWRGFPLEPAPGSWERLKEHIFENISGGDERVYHWFLNWFAFGVQRRGEVPGTAPVLMGPPGVGKGFLANSYGELWGYHYASVTHHDHVVGRFNQHLLARRFVFVDEGLFGGNRKEAGVMKARITEQHIVFEQKGVDPIKLPNRTMFMVASNEASVVPADIGDRRWMIVRVGDRRREDHEFFGAIANELANGGYAAMLHELLGRDISKGPNPRKTIKGPELYLQILRAQPFFIQYFHRILDEGRLPQNTVAGASVTTIKALHAEMRALHPEARHLNDNALGMHLREMFPEIKSSAGGLYVVRIEQGYPVTERSTKYFFPRLVDSRMMFEEKIGAPIRWTNDLVDWLSDNSDDAI